MALKQSSLVIGRQPLVEALQSGRALDKIWMQKNASGEVLQTIRQLAKEAGVPIQAVPPEKLNGLTRANHQGVIAVAALVQYLPLQSIIDHVVSAGQAPLFVMLDGVTDVRNIGAIARTAVCCGAQALIIPDKGVGA
ncbi:MAG: 23S rRNA (guanosine(2251)-2'-O)-methyltransferase RlmB, partial [Sphingobacteriia bacterium]